MTVDLVADPTVVNPFDFFTDDYAESFPFVHPAALAGDLDPYLRPVDETPGNGPGPAVVQWMAQQGLDRHHQPLRIVDSLAR